MAIRPDGTALRQFRTLFHLGATGDLTDGQLLERFATGRGRPAELAFAVLVERHGPLVLRACRAVLRDEHDAQDAFQATFLVLVRKADSLWVRDSLGPWLHAVAYRAARCSRSSRARRRDLEPGPAGLESALVVPVQDRDDLARAVHEEVERLPERFRGPVILCDLEGLTQEQAARRLGCPVGTVKSRLARGRLRLRDRLTRRGLAPAVGIGSVLGGTGTQASVPSALVQSTIGIALQAAAGRVAVGVVPAAVAGLVQGVSKAMLYAKIKVLAVPMLAVGVAAGAGVNIQGDGRAAEPLPVVSGPSGRDPDRRDEVPLHEVKRGELDVSVIGRGNLEASSSIEVHSPIEGETTILLILPEGTRVVKDLLVFELDPAPLRDRLADQQIATEQARADFDNAVKTLDIAEINVKEYLEGIYPQEYKTIEGEIKLAESELERSKNRLSWSDDMLELGYVTQAQNLRDKFNLQRAEFNLEQAERKLEVLQEYTKHKQVKALEIDVEKARAQMRVKQAAWEVEQSKERDLREQIQQCKVFAPAGGMIVYPWDWDEEPIRRRDGPAIREGDTVREGQHIMTIVDLDRPMRAIAKVHESIVHRVGPGQRVQIRVDAFPNQLFDGTVAVVHPRPDPRGDSDSGPKLYTTLVEFEEPSPYLRPGMTAEVQILVGPADLLSVPTRAVLQHDGKAYVAVSRADDGFEWHEVTLGLSDGMLVEVKLGVGPGDLVATDPLALLRRGSEPEAPGAEDGPEPVEG